MSLYYVTGLSGTGKSAVLTELRARGYLARGVDEDGEPGDHGTVIGSAGGYSRRVAGHRVTTDG
ncbi:MAG TPA: hypothetical protein VFQ44_26725 [Streptosporangiaceae bacterium]|nr:hypothetical protein [Streptosporangiaceae bacterium]